MRITAFSASIFSCVTFNGVKFVWKMIRLTCGWRDSNPHALRRQILSLVCLPISPHPLVCISSMPCGVPIYIGIMSTIPIAIGITTPACLYFLNALRRPDLYRDNVCHSDSYWNHHTRIWGSKCRAFIFTRNTKTILLWLVQQFYQYCYQATDCNSVNSFGKL